MIGVASLIREMPKGYEAACFETKAIMRKRDIKDPNDLMLLSLYHLLTGCSLIEISEISKLAKLGDISDVAFMKRFRNCNEWFKWIISHTKSEGLSAYTLPESIMKYRVLAVDATDVSEKGRSGRIYRLHYALDVFKMHSVYYSITTNEVGEHLRNFELAQNDLVLADRGYSTLSGIEYCRSRGAQFVIRMRSKCFKSYDENGKEICLLEHFKNNESGSLNIYAKNAEHSLIPVRICYSRKSKEAIESTKKKLNRKEIRKQITISEETREFNEYIIVATSLPDEISAEDILELYRYRWQVELYFKRLKSILDYGEMPKRTKESVFAWLNGKLMVALLIEKIVSEASFPPTHESFEEYLEGDEDGNPATEE